MKSQSNYNYALKDYSFWYLICSSNIPTTPKKNNSKAHSADASFHNITSQLKKHSSFKRLRRRSFMKSSQTTTIKSHSPINPHKRQTQKSKQPTDRPNVRPQNEIAQFCSAAIKKIDFLLIFFPLQFSPSLFVRTRK